MASTKKMTSIWSIKSMGKKWSSTYTEVAPKNVKNTIYAPMSMATIPQTKGVEILLCDQKKARLVNLTIEEGQQKVRL